MSHAKANIVPIVVAINKCDKAGANSEKVKLQLASEGLLLEEMGGDVQVVEVSATEKIGLDNLEEALLLQADMMDLKARIHGLAQANVLEVLVEVVEGDARNVLCDVVDRHRASILVLGSHSYGAIKRVCLEKQLNVKNKPKDNDSDHNVDFAAGNVKLITTKEAWDQYLEEARRDGKIGTQGVGLFGAEKMNAANSEHSFCSLKHLDDKGN
ncbi:Translation initiation factor IF-2 [Glycine soja]|uniref:Translation initiation factor IF-2 n=1 Tax=Glycine soja TaxID=3848 RepID=A0A445JUU0_GLYSO|nr:Translation initiation factor IF-2 [Glycine soja]